MTRGLIALLQAGQIYVSGEFNGDMGDKARGGTVISGLGQVKTLEEFEDLIEEFNARFFLYPYDRVAPRVKAQSNADHFVDLDTDYNTNWHSDYLYIKNADDQAWVIRPEQNASRANQNEMVPDQHILIYPGQIMWFRFGRYAGDSRPQFLSCDAPAEPEQEPVHESPEDAEFIEIMEELESIRSLVQRIVGGGKEVNRRLFALSEKLQKMSDL